MRYLVAALVAMVVVAGCVTEQTYTADLDEENIFVEHQTARGDLSTQAIFDETETDARIRCNSFDREARPVSAWKDRVLPGVWANTIVYRALWECVQQ